MAQSKMKGGGGSATATATTTAHFLLLIVIVLASINPLASSSSDEEATVMQSLRKTLNPPPSLGWVGDDHCQWPHIGCSGNLVTRIQLGHQNLQSGTLPPSLSPLTSLQRLELQSNNLTGPLPSLAGLASLQVIMLSHNHFTSIPPDFFRDLPSLQSVEIDNNPFASWSIPSTLASSSSLQNFSANSANITGPFPEIFSPDNFPGLVNLHLAFNNLSGSLPASLAGSQIESLWLNGNHITGTLDVVANMTYLTEVWLHSNSLTGPLPDFSALLNLETFSARDNSLTGTIPHSLVSLASLKVVNLTNNLLQGPVPVFPDSVASDIGTPGGSMMNSFCLPETPGAECGFQVGVMLSVAKSMGYPTRFAQSWKGNDVCAGWFGIICSHGNVTVINFSKLGLNGSVSPDFSKLKSLQRLILSDNYLAGTIPAELLGTDGNLPSLTLLDLSNNRLHGKVPEKRKNLVVNVDGNPDIGKDKPTSPGSSSNSSTALTPSGNLNSTGYIDHDKLKSSSSSSSSLSRPTVIILCVFVGFFALLVIAFLSFCLYRRKQKRFSQVQSPNAIVVHPRNSPGSDNENTTTNSVKITVAGSNTTLVGGDTIFMNGGGDIQMVEAGGTTNNNNMVISIQVLRTVTDNFSEDNILGQGGFGTVYKGELHDGTKIAVKRMEIGVITGKGLAEFKSEIAVLTKVRHRHLVALLGYCLDGDERLLVYEYMPQGTLSSHIFNWGEEGLKPLEWTRRLSIALDVARGVEYLHTLAHQSFIHRDLKPSNILLGDDLRAKVADFGLVRLAPEGKVSVETRIAGTFGYLAPEYAVTGRVTTKVDVFSFGVILMELITGRRALDESQPEESVHLVTWFKRMHINKETFSKAIDPILDLNDDTLASIRTVAELAGHCCAREPYQRPDMGHAVNVLSSLVELWKPTEPTADDIYGIDLDMSLPQALKKWQAFEGSQGAGPSFIGSGDNTQTSIPTRPYGFAESFTSADGR